MKKELLKQGDVVEWKHPETGWIPAEVAGFSKTPYTREPACCVRYRKPLISFPHLQYAIVPFTELRDKHKLTETDRVTFYDEEYRIWRFGEILSVTDRKCTVGYYTLPDSVEYDEEVNVFKSQLRLVASGRKMLTRYSTVKVARTE